MSALASIQAPVRSELDQVSAELRRIVISDFEMIEDVNEHLLVLQGKLFRPTLLLLSSRVDGEPHVWPLQNQLLRGHDTDRDLGKP